MPIRLYQAKNCFTRPLREEIHVSNFSQLAMMQLRVCRDLRHDGFRLVMPREILKVGRSSRTAEA